MTSRPNPYVGPRAFEKGETLYGRNREIRQLKALLVAERIVLLHSPSGAGKTSLIQAGLLPILLEENFSVLPVIRVNLEPPAPAAGQAVNRYLLSTLLSLEEGILKEQRLPIEQLARLSLDEYLLRRNPDGKPESLALVFDQFEEILTTSPTDREGKLAYFELLGTALRNRDRWALFAIRDDYLGALSPYLRPIPNRLSSTFRLDLLGAEAAVEAIQSPARDAGGHFDEGAARRLVKDLSTVQVQHPNGTIEEQEGLYVEPVQLQVVCYRLWETQPEDDLEITAEDLSRIGNVDRALAEYYAARVAHAAKTSGVSERDIRDWFEKRLITPEGIRGQVLMSSWLPEGGSQPVQDHPNGPTIARTDGSPAPDFSRAISDLVDAHIVRSEKRAGATWYELAHDRLIDPVRASNAAWYTANLKLFQQQAALWDAQGRPKGLLLQEKELEQARLDAMGLDLTAEETTFLNESRLADEESRRERQRVRAITLLAILATIALVIAGVFWAQARAAARAYANLAAENAQTAQTAEAAKAEALVQKSIAEENAAIAIEKATLARAAELATQALAIQDDDFLVSLLLGIESFRTMDVYQTRSALLTNARSHPQLRMHLSEHREVVTSVSYSPDGKTIASAGWDGMVVLWDAANGQPLGAPLVGYNDRIKSIAFSPDGKYLAVSGDSRTILVWDLATRKTLNPPLAGHKDRIVSLAFSPDSKILASGSWDTTIILWNMLTLQPIGAPLQGQGGSVSNLAFSPDGSLLASGGFDNSVILWDVAAQRQVGKPLTGHTDGISSVAFHPNGKILASASFDQTIRLWDLASRRLIGQPIEGHDDAVLSIAFHPNGKTLASASRDRTIRLWDITLKQPSSRQLTGHTDAVATLAFSPDGSSLVSGGFDARVILWDSQDNHPLIHRVLTGHTGGIRGIDFSPDGNLLASASNDQTIRVWDLRSPKLTGQPLTGHSRVVTSLAFSPDGSKLASGSGDNTILLWDPAQLKPIGRPLTGHRNAILSLAFRPDGSVLASGGFDNAILIWDILNQQLIRKLSDQHTDPVSSLAFRPDGRMLASGSYDKTIVLWDTSTWQPVGQTLTGHTGLVTSLAFSPDGKILASGSNEPSSGGTVILWDIDRRQMIGRPLVGHTSAVNNVSFSPDGKLLASASSDKSIILWDVAGQKQIGQPLNEHREGVTSVDFSPDGKILASGSYDNTILLWEVDPLSWIQASCTRAGRNFTQDEWQQYFPGEPYRITCPDFPQGQ